MTLQCDTDSAEPTHGELSPTRVEAGGSARERNRARRSALSQGRSGGDASDGLSVESRGRSPSFELSLEALRSGERERLRITSQIMMGMTGLGFALSPIMGGDPLARKIFACGMAVAFATMIVLYQSSYRKADNTNLVGFGGVVLASVNTCALYYMGTFSLASMTGALGLYIFCLGGQVLWCAAVYAALAVPHGVLAVLIMAGAVTDRGIVSAGDLALQDLVALQGCAQAVYVIAFLAGRRSRQKLEQVFGELERAARVLSQRDALLDEAKRDLERAVRIGGEGRFTDQVVGSFRLGNVIGRGGMGEVYEAAHVHTDEPAAVKLLQRALFSDPSSLARFAREARALTSLHSPHVVRVIEAPGEQSAIPYLAMERLRGEDLASMLRREQRLSPRELATLAQQVGAGLDDAHASGVIHRDIKPQNLFLARRDGASSTWKVLDFGVSKLVGQGTLTRDQVVGTPDYMAPEQAAGITVTPQADLYGLAAVLYRCVASRPPFTGPSMGSLLHKVIHQMPPRPSNLGRVSSDLEVFLAIGLSKVPEERYASGAELAATFQAAIEGNLPPVMRERAALILQRTPWADA